MRKATIIAAALVLGGCATVPEDGAPGTTALPVRIIYETGPCFGTCPVYGLDVGADGTGRFDGKRFTAVSGTRAFAVTPAQFGAFAAALAPYRPATDRRFAPGEPGCSNAPTDMPSVEVRWSDADGRTAKLSYYFGCDGENPGMSAGLRRAVEALPVADLIGRR